MKKKSLTTLTEVARKELKRQSVTEERRQKYRENPKTVFIPQKLYFLPDFSNLPYKCPYDNEIMDRVYNVSAKYDGVSFQGNGCACMKCERAYVVKPHAIVLQEMRQKKHKNQIVMKDNQAEKQEQEATESVESVSFATQDNRLFICKGLIVCKKNGHNVQSATGVLFGNNDDIIKINTNYCPECRKYFIGYDEYIRYREKYGVLLGNIKLSSGSFTTIAGNLADESILHVCGYSVNQTDNISSDNRRRILKYLIDSRVSSKPEIIGYLNYFIKRNGKKRNMEEAVRRWNDDLSWVRDYQIDRQRVFEIKQIIKNR